MRDLQISDAEWDVMQQVWAAESCKAADVIRQLSETHDWNPSTIRTLLARLVEKGALKYEVDGAKYIYRAAVSREQCVRRESRTFLEKAFGGDVGALLNHFVAESSLSPEQIDQLRRLLAEQQSGKGKRT
ncbi:BlaI/MecI/CopY family transcriptional regulator [Blastopirellula retiformator]|uniref:Penicillinase repressor n=1 Tax=Blastopirellula retiformator TaxID=2527970 RepID=A0A5C5V1A9_9BACT|nr:BlaI/MecI/CopY family transcriptional regulator [Blastopirellula retiformator]TWT31547.1 Penicillinase repressor [Blastopirellula retiformator]